MLGDSLNAQPDGKPRERQGYYQSVLSGGKPPENIGGLAINSPDISKISIPANQEGFGTNDMSNIGHELGLQSSPYADGESPGKLGYATSSGRLGERNLFGDQLQNGIDEMIDNPAEMDMLDGDDEDQDDDPEILEEMDRRHEEIIEEFMEMSYNCKHDAREVAMAQEEDGTDLQAKLQAINKKMD